MIIKEKLIPDKNLVNSSWGYSDENYIASELDYSNLLSRIYSVAKTRKNLNFSDQFIIDKYITALEKKKK